MITYSVPNTIWSRRLCERSRWLYVVPKVPLTRLGGGGDTSLCENSEIETLGNGIPPILDLEVLSFYPIQIFNKGYCVKFIISNTMI